MVKTNAVRALDNLGIKYELREYEVDTDDLSAETVAAKIGLPPEQLRLGQDAVAHAAIDQVPHHLNVVEVVWESHFNLASLIQTFHLLLRQ